VAYLYRPAAPGYADQGGKRAGPAVRLVAVEVGQVAGVGEAGADEQVVARGRSGQICPAVVPLALGPVPGRSGLPAAGRDESRGVIGADLLPRRQGDPERAGDLQHVPGTPGFQEAAQFRVPPVDLVAGHPRRAAPLREEFFHDLGGELRLGLELQVIRHPGDAAPSPVIGPVLRHIQASRDDRVPGRGGVAGVDHVDAVGDPPGTAQVLALHPGGVLAGLLLPGLVDHQHRIGWLAQVACRELPNRGHRRKCVPGRASQQPLHPVRRGVSGPLGQRPAVLPRQVADQPGDVLAGLAARLHPGKTARQPARQQLVQVPAGQRGLFYSGGSSRLKIVSCHKLMIMRRLPRMPQILRSSGHPRFGQVTKYGCPTR
jgi:hypothetical protein